MRELRYGLSTEVDGAFDDVVAKVTAALKTQGFGVLTTIDVQKTMKEKTGADLQPYVILGACNPALAYTALMDDIETGLLLPCNVTVRQEDGRCTVSILDPKIMAEISDAPGLKEVSEIARKKLEAVVGELEGVEAAPQTV
jgi:uncharacterized protein (DUF302 family)